MKRHNALIPLTHDHHHALAQARKLRNAATSEGADGRMAQARAFLSFFADDTIQHFHEEEELVFPKLLDYVDSPPDVLVDILIEHVRIHGLVRRLEGEVDSGSVAGDTLREIGELLHAHIRLEEGKLFPLMEKVVPEEDLGRLVLAARNRAGAQRDGG